MPSVMLRLIAAGALIALPAAALAQPSAADFERRFAPFLEAMRTDPSAPPAFAIVVVQGDRTLLARVFGARDLGTGAPLTLDTPMYTASVTKSPVGLIAAQLDHEGVLPLSATLADVWPGITLATGQDPARTTAISFLSHVSGIESPAIQWRYSDTGEFRTSDVRALLPRHATRANRAYDYGNIGPVIYTAMAETRTGQSWRDLLQRYVVRPLGLTRTSARLEDFAANELSRCNTRVGGAWQPVPNKPTALLDAGGGIYSSPRDAGNYLRAFTSEGRSAGGAIPAAVLRRTYEQASVQDRMFLGFHRTGYGLGWDLSEYDGHRVVSRSGGSVGCRTFIAFLPEQHFGVVVFALSDAGGNAFTTGLIQQAMDFWTGDSEADANAAARLRAFSTAARAAIVEADARPGIPADRRAGASSDYAGLYDAEGFGRITISAEPEGLEARAGVLRLLLAPKGEGRFDAFDAAVPGPPWQMRFDRDQAGTVNALVLNGQSFRRRAGAAR